MKAEAPRPFLTLALGVVLIAILAPVTQFLTILATNASAETATPVAWAVGLVFSFVLAGLVFYRLTRMTLLSRGSLALLYMMLTIAVPLMNLGLARQVVLSQYIIFREYLYEGNSTYNTAYTSLSEDWYPLAPTEEGMAFVKAERLVEILTDGEAVAARQAARRDLALVLVDAREFAMAQEAPARLQELFAAVDRLGADEASSLLGLGEEALGRAETIGLRSPIEARRAQAVEDSEAARTILAEELASVDEYALLRTPQIAATLNLSTQERIDDDFGRQPEERQAILTAEAAVLAPQLERWFVLVSRLAASDQEQLRRSLTQARLDAWELLEPEEVDAIRHSFVFRQDREGRRDLIADLRSEGGPNLNIDAMRVSLWPTAADQRAKEEASFFENVVFVWENIPWELWLGPMLRWALLIATIFLFLMCVAEWLRRKWVDRENLAFPLVEAIDYVIRHDKRLETASDLRDPESRRRNFYPYFLIGLAFSFIILTAEALGHYGFLGARPMAAVNGTTTILSNTPLSSIADLVLALSPILIGIFFLLSLQMSFSIWSLFLVFVGAIWLGQIGEAPKDSMFTGFNGGKLYPFYMEQMLGAALVFASVLIWKAWGTSAKPSNEPETDRYVPSRLNTIGLLGLPLVICFLLWDLGIESFTLLALYCISVMALTLTSARLRAEAGIPLVHATYEFTKFPMILGLTGMSGSKAFIAFCTQVFLPVSLLFRTLPQQIENIELARRYRIRYGTVALVTIVAFIAAIGFGLTSYLVFAHYVGDDFFAARPLAGQPSSGGTYHAAYPLWVSHFLGQYSLDDYTSINWLRVGTIVVGAVVTGLLLFCRKRFLAFPFHPIGYIAVLFTIHFQSVTPYVSLEERNGIEQSTIWGSALAAWLIKKLLIKYGGMRTYKRAKPFFIGLIVGGILAVFAWNGVDLFASLMGAGSDEPGDFITRFLEAPPFSPAYYLF